MKQFKANAPFLLELITKAVSFLTSLILIYSLTTSEFGEFSYVRSFVLVLGTLLLLGLQTSTFKFANYTSPLKTEYLTFSVVFIFVLSTLSSLLLNILSEEVFGKFESTLGEWIKYLLLPSMLTMFFVAYYKAIGRPIKGFLLSLFSASFLFLSILIFNSTSTLSLDFVLNALLVSSILCCSLALIISASELLSGKLPYKKWPIREWFNISLSMWLAGFLPLFLLQGMVLFFGLFYGSTELGIFSIAIVIVANLATFKEIAISLYLPKMIGHFNQTNSINFKLLVKCIIVGTLPIVLFLLLSLLFQPMLIKIFSTKLSNDFFQYLYILICSQLIMATYQPIWRVLSSIGFHKTILRGSIALTTCLLGLYAWFGYSQQPLFFVGSSTLTSFFALGFGILLLKRNVWIKS